MSGANDVLEDEPLKAMFNEAVKISKKVIPTPTRSFSPLFPKILDHGGPRWQPLKVISDDSAHPMHERMLRINSGNRRATRLSAHSWRNRRPSQ